MVANLGRIDLRGDKLDRLVSSLNKYCKNKLVTPGQIECKEALPWGQVLLVRLHHKKDDRIEAHIFVATLALFLKCSLEYQLASKLPQLSGTDALAAMRSIGLSELDIDGKVVRLVSGGGRDAKQILSALKIKEINPPAPRKNH